MSKPLSLLHPALRVLAACLAISAFAIPTGMASAQEAPPNAAPPAPPAPEQAPAAPPKSPAPGIETPAVVLDGATDTLLGKPVLSADGEDMGRIIDVIVDNAGMMRAAIIDFGGFLGVGSRKIAVDWRVLHFAQDGSMDRVTAELSRDQLRVAPVYKPGEPVVVVGRAAGAAPPAKPPADGAPAANPPAAVTPSPAPAAPPASTDAPAKLP